MCWKMIRVSDNILHGEGGLLENVKTKMSQNCDVCVHKHRLPSVLCSIFCDVLENDLGDCENMLSSLIHIEKGDYWEW